MHGSLSEYYTILQSCTINILDWFICIHKELCVNFRMFSSISGLYPLDPSQSTHSSFSPPPTKTFKVSSHIAKCLLEGQNCT